MKRMIKIMALLTAALLIASALVACGDSSSDTAADSNTPAATQAEPAATEAKDVTGAAAEWGSYSVLVPEGFELAEGGEFSSYDFAVKKSDFSYFDFNTEADDDNMMQHYNYNKSTYTNEQKDVEATYGANQWTGFQYSDGFGGWGFEAYTTIDGKIVRVSAAGFTFDSAEAQAVLSSFAKK